MKQKAVRSPRHLNKATTGEVKASERASLEADGNTGHFTYLSDGIALFSFLTQRMPMDHDFGDSGVSNDTGFVTPASTLTSNSPLSYVTAFQSQAVSAASFNPTSSLSRDLAQIFNTLLEKSIPGPTLIRLRTEFNHVLGRGRQFEVLALSGELQALCATIETGAATSGLVDIRLLKTYAVKYPLPPSTASRFGSNEDEVEAVGDATSRSFAAQLHSAKVEIEKLCKDSLRQHPNIVKLLRWGLCLDTLENPFAQIPRIPLLILERATTDLRQFMRKSSPAQHPYDVSRQICLDIGRGLGALHREDIYHGDLKLENVLMFWQGGSWTAKLCDFGMSGSSHDDAVDYRGTDGWIPPEMSTSHLFGASNSNATVSPLLKCDLFAYGLITWAVFTGKWDSPIRNNRFCVGSSPDRYIVAAKTEYLRLLKFRTDDSQVVKPLPLTPTRTSPLQKMELDLREQEETRVFLVFHNALSCEPGLRNVAPWSFLDSWIFPRVDKRDLEHKPVKKSLMDLVLKAKQLVPKAWNIRQSKLANSRSQGSKQMDRFHLPASMPVDGTEEGPLQDRLLGFVHFDHHQDKPTIRSQIKAIFTKSWPGNGQHQFCEEVFNSYTASWGISADFDSLDPFPHPESGHLDLHALCNRLRNLVRWSTHEYDFEIKRYNIPSAFKLSLQGPSVRTSLWRLKPEEKLLTELYVLARIRSRSSLCCWNATLVTVLPECRQAPSTESRVENPVNWDNHLLRLIFQKAGTVLDEPETSQHEPIFRCRHIHPIFRFRDPHIVPWLCRGPIAQVEFSMLHTEPKIIWNFACSTEIPAPKRASIAILLLENGCNIEDSFVLEKGEAKTAFRHFLESIPTSGNAHASCAEEVCRHFKRVAHSASTPSSTRSFLSGVLELIVDDTSKGSRDVHTTALHEAVLANRYLAVECLVRGGFVVDALDDQGRNAFVLATEYQQSARSLAEQRENDRIVVFLQQGMGMRKPKKSGLPRGWEHIPVKITNSVIDRHEESDSLQTIAVNNLPAAEWIVPIDIRTVIPVSETKINTSTASRRESIDPLTLAQSFIQKTPRSTVRQFPNQIYLERHTNSITLKPPKISIIEDQRLALGFQTITGPRKVVGSENQVYGLDLVPFFNRNHPQLPPPTVQSRSIANDLQETAPVDANKNIELSTTPSFGVEWFEEDMLKLKDIPYDRLVTDDRYLTKMSLLVGLVHLKKALLRFAYRWKPLRYFLLPIDRFIDWFITSQFGQNAAFWIERCNPWISWIKSWIDTLLGSLFFWVCGLGSLVFLNFVPGIPPAYTIVCGIVNSIALPILGFAVMFAMAKSCGMDGSNIVELACVFWTAISAELLVVGLQLVTVRKFSANNTFVITTYPHPKCTQSSHLCLLASVSWIILEWLNSGVRQSTPQSTVVFLFAISWKWSFETLLHLIVFLAIMATIFTNCWATVRGFGKITSPLQKWIALIFFPFVNLTVWFVVIVQLDQRTDLTVTGEWVFLGLYRAMYSAILICPIVATVDCFFGSSHGLIFDSKQVAVLGCASLIAVWSARNMKPGRLLGACLIAAYSLLSWTVGLVT
ncbi:hypothetical protein G7Y89_g9721 [Cudoniella acicularis]|uniref:Protein kinase domain-containing protein n=1 Tax=Cudoniella acicularis TaxID=354080 RepID=A0A8H4RGX2_9HELO|nr:hypothetical protein G7Y89_g9721 [Cudoniella acicularis]